VAISKRIDLKLVLKKTQHLNHRAQLTAQNAKIFAEIRELSEKTRLAALV